MTRMPRRTRASLRRSGGMSSWRRTHVKGRSPLILSAGRKQLDYKSLVLSVRKSLTVRRHRLKRKWGTYALQALELGRAHARARNRYVRAREYTTGFDRTNFGKGMSLLRMY